MFELYKAIAGSPITYLAADISANQTTISIADDSALPDGPNICTIGYGENIETIRYGAKSNGVLQNVTRGIEGTPRAWPAGTEVARFFTAYDYNALIENFNSHLADYATFKEGVVNKNDPLFLGSTGVGAINLTGSVFDYKFIEIRTANPSDAPGSRSAAILIPTTNTMSYPLVFNASFGYIRFGIRDAGTRLEIASMGPASDMRLVAVTGILKIT